MPVVLPLLPVEPPPVEVLPVEPPPLAGGAGSVSSVSPGPLQPGSSRSVLPSPSSSLRLLQAGRFPSGCRSEPPGRLIETSAPPTPTLIEPAIADAARARDSQEPQARRRLVAASSSLCLFNPCCCDTASGRQKPSSATSSRRKAQAIRLAKRFATPNPRLDRNRAGQGRQRQLGSTSHVALHRHASLGALTSAEPLQGEACVTLGRTRRKRRCEAKKEASVWRSRMNVAGSAPRARKRSASSRRR